MESNIEDMDMTFTMSAHRESDCLVRNCQDSIEDALSPGTFDFVLGYPALVEAKRLGTHGCTVLTAQELEKESTLPLCDASNGNESVRHCVQESMDDASNKPAVCTTWVEMGQDSTMASYKDPLDAFLSDTCMPQQQELIQQQHLIQQQQPIQQQHLIQQQQPIQQQQLIQKQQPMQQQQPIQQRESQNPPTQLVPSNSGRKFQLSRRSEDHERRHRKDDTMNDLYMQLFGSSPRSSTSLVDKFLAKIFETETEDEIMALILGTDRENNPEVLVLSSSKDPFDTGDQEKIDWISKIIDRCEQTESRKVLVHQFVLAILVAGHCRMFSTGLTGLLTFSTEDGVDTDEMSENFAVRDKDAVGRIWNKVKENKKGKFDTFARAMRLGRERNKGYFDFLSAGKRAKKLIYKLGPKGMDDLRSWVATCKTAFVTDDWNG